jgi:hypothetical protein
MAYVPIVRVLKVYSQKKIDANIFVEMDKPIRLLRSVMMVTILITMDVAINA